VEPDDPEYRRLAEQEAAFWATNDEGFCEVVDSLGPSVVEAAANRRFTGDSSTRWYETIAARGDFREALFLGTSAIGQDARILEMNPRLHATFCDIAAGSLERWQRELESRFPGRIDTRVEDLNFVELPVNAYDLVISSSTIHHIINLEHLAEQINRALRPNGIFVLQDLVAESRHALSPEKKRIFQLLYDREIDRQNAGRSKKLHWINEDPARFSPFCGIRSGDILRVFGERLEQRELRTAGTVSGLLLYAKPADDVQLSLTFRVRRRLTRMLHRILPGKAGRLRPLMINPQFMDELLLVDDVLCETNALVPFNAFAVYGKRT
jgi:SAM-dependent methyltransferase